MIGPIQRLFIAIGAVGVAGGALALVGMGSLGDDIVYYWSPSELQAHGDSAKEATVRLGGVVVPGSVDWNRDASRLAFKISDGVAEVPVSCTGAPPQMFREGIGVVVEGKLQADGVFHTQRVMVKHSNEYRAPAEGAAPDAAFKTLEEES
jgi:cytochrome c-type biogenesis protein CcmE